MPLRTIAAKGIPYSVRANRRHSGIDHRTSQIASGKAPPADQSIPGPAPCHEGDAWPAAASIPAISRIKTSGGAGATRLD